MTLESAIHREPCTGDVLACYGRGIVAAAIAWLTPRWAIWRPAPSHVAVIAVKSDRAAPQPWVYESTTMSRLRDGLAGDAREGVQAHLLSDWLDNCNGRVDYYPLKVRMTRSGESAAMAYAEESHARSAPYDMRGAIRSGTVLRNTENGERLFCSEFIAFLLRKGGSIGTHVNCSEVTPHDITRMQCFAAPVRVK